MYSFAHALVFGSFLIAILGCIFAGFSVDRGKFAFVRLFEGIGFLLAVALSAASLILFNAFAHCDFALQYVADYSDRAMPLFYRVTAFWAGQPGSLLFWAWATSFFGLFFQYSSAYGKLKNGTRLLYWLFYLAVMGFFLFLLCTWNDPFILAARPLQDGNGLNPLLQNPGMIFHPPLLFLGYAGFTISGILAFAQGFSGAREVEGSWTRLARPFTLLAWIFLTAGIVLGCWWSYMELGWGGYWAWDPVENASLIPWLIGTACIHTSVIQDRRNKLHRFNALLIMLTMASAFFATYLVRSNVIQSLHAFGGNEIGLPLLIFVLVLVFLAALAARASGSPHPKPMGPLISREGLLMLMAWLFIALSLIILIGTLWPVLSSLWSEKPMGLDRSFYNRTCLPLFGLLGVLLCFCPWLGWKGGIRHKKGFLTAAAVFVIAALLCAFSGMHMPLALIACAFAISSAAGAILLPASDPAMRNTLSSIGACGAHLGAALIIMAVAWSGPYQEERTLELSLNESVTLDGRTFTFAKLSTGVERNYTFARAELTVSKDGDMLGTLRPEQRFYYKYPDRPFNEAAVIPGFGTEPYATLGKISPDMRKAVFRLSTHPLINWFWIGSALMCVCALLTVRRRSGGNRKS